MLFNNGISQNTHIRIQNEISRIRTFIMDQFFSIIEEFIARPTRTITSKRLTQKRIQYGGVCKWRRI